MFAPRTVLLGIGLLASLLSSCSRDSSWRPGNEVAAGLLSMTPAHELAKEGSEFEWNCLVEERQPGETLYYKYTATVYDAGDASNEVVARLARRHPFPFAGRADVCFCGSKGRDRCGLAERLMEGDDNPIVSVRCEEEEYGGARIERCYCGDGAPRCGLGGSLASWQAVTATAAR